MRSILKMSAAVAAAASAAFVGFSVPAAHAFPLESPSWGAANLISYDNSDFENNVGNWVNYSNSAVAQSTSTAFLHSHALKMTATTAGSQAIKMGTGTSAPQVQVNGGDVYRESAWVKTQGGSGRTVTFADGFYDSFGNWLGWTSGTAVTLATKTGWQYVEGTITAPSNADHMVGSPRITEGSVSAGETLWVDEILVVPDRAATIVGAETPDGNCASSNFATINTSIGPLQSCKIFYGSGTPIPSSFSGSICDLLPGNVTCVISFKNGGTNDGNLKSFVRGIPARRNVVLIYWQEPEHTWSSTGASYVAQFETEANDIRSSLTSSNAENVFVASDAEAYQYDATSSNHHKGTDCSFIPPSGTSGSPDFYFMDQYEFTAQANKNLAQDTNDDVSTETNNWLSCVTPYNHPLGVAEIGYNCNGGQSDPNNVTTTEAMVADNAYLGGNPDGLPTVLYEYWYDNNVGCEFTGSSQVSEWRSIEAQNGGGTN